MTQVADPTAPQRCILQERFVLVDGVHIVRMISRGGVPPHAGDLMKDYMTKLAADVNESRQRNEALCIHGGVGGKTGHFIVPGTSIAYAQIEMIDEDTGDVIEAQPGYLAEQPARVGVVRNLRRVDRSPGAVPAPGQGDPRGRP